MLCIDESVSVPAVSHTETTFLPDPDITVWTSFIPLSSALMTRPSSHHSLLFLQWLCLCGTSLMGDSRTGGDHCRRLTRTEKTVLTKSAVYQKKQQRSHSITVKMGIIGCLGWGLERPGDLYCPPSTKVTWTQFSRTGSHWCGSRTPQNWETPEGVSARVSLGVWRDHGKSAISLLSVNNADKLVQTALKLWGFVVTNRHCY